MRSEDPYSQEKNYMDSAGTGHRAMLVWLRGLDTFLTMPVPNVHAFPHGLAAQVTEAQDHPRYTSHADRPMLEAEGDELKRIPTGIDNPYVADIPQPRTPHP